MLEVSSQYSRMFSAAKICSDCLIHQTLNCNTVTMFWVLYLLTRNGKWRDFRQCVLPNFQTKDCIRGATFVIQIYNKITNGPCYSFCLALISANTTFLHHLASNNYRMMQEKCLISSYHQDFFSSKYGCSRFFLELPHL